MDRQPSRPALFAVGATFTVMVFFCGYGIRGCSPEVVKPKPTPPIEVVVPPEVKPATAAIYIYEKDDTAVPTGVKLGIAALNKREGFTASMYEEESVPSRYATALRAAQNAGLPALVVIAGGPADIVKVVHDPQTEESVTGAAK